MRLSSLLLTVSLVAALPCLADDQFKDEFRQTFQQASGGRLDVSSFNGRIEVTGWDQNTVEVTGAKHARDAADLSQIRVEITQSGNVVTARAFKEDKGSKCRNCGAYFIIRVPRRTELSRLKTSNGRVAITTIEGLTDAATSNGSVTLREIKGRTSVTTSNGAIDVDNVEGEMKLRTSNGAVKIGTVKGALEAVTSNGSIRGIVSDTGGVPLKFSTSNGTIDMSFRGGTGTGDIVASSSNGSVIIRLPATAGARVDATTSSGESIQTDFDVQVQGVLSKGKLQGTIGSGGPLLQLSTSNGSIRILKN